MRTALLDYPDGQPLFDSAFGRRSRDVGLIHEALLQLTAGHLAHVPGEDGLAFGLLVQGCTAMVQAAPATPGAWRTDALTSLRWMGMGG